jgi:hypothetical protein
MAICTAIPKMRWLRPWVARSVEKSSHAANHDATTQPRNHATTHAYINDVNTSASVYGEVLAHV